MAGTKKIIIADDDSDMRQFLNRLLSRMGHEIVAAAHDGNELIEQCRLHRPDLVISDIRMPLRDGLSAASELCRSDPVPIILVTAHVDRDLVQAACENNVMAYLVKPLNGAEVEAAIEIAITRFTESSKLRQEADNLRQALEDRKIIERAKGVLMKRASLDEQTAFRRLQKMASARNMRLADLARRVCDAAESADWS